MLYRGSIITIAMLLLTVLLASCKANSFYISDYKQAQQQVASNAINRQQVEELFSYVFLNMKQGNLAERVKSAYADELYFNDTFHTYKTLPNLASYLQKTADRVVRLDAQIDDVSINGSNVYIRWTMTFQVNENSQALTSVGITHLRFNDVGKIILHQDYWDGVEGFYRSVPVLGSMLKGVRQRL